MTSGFKVDALNIEYKVTHIEFLNKVTHIVKEAEKAREANSAFFIIFQFNKISNFFSNISKQF